MNKTDNLHNVIKTGDRSCEPQLVSSQVLCQKDVIVPSRFSMLSSPWNWYRYSISRNTCCPVHFGSLKMDPYGKDFIVPIRFPIFPHSSNFETDTQNYLTNFVGLFVGGNQKDVIVPSRSSHVPHVSNWYRYSHVLCHFFACEFSYLFESWSYYRVLVEFRSFLYWRNSFDAPYPSTFVGALLHWSSEPKLCTELLVLLLTKGRYRSKPIYQFSSFPIMKQILSHLR